MDDELASSDDDAALVDLPAFEAGGRIERTGIALVHEGEYIVPSQGSAAEIAGDVAAGAHLVTLRFPIEVEVVGQLSDAHKQQVADFVFEQLDSALRSRP